MMKKALLAFFAVILLGFAGILIDAGLGFDGTLGIIIAIATAGAFIVFAIEEKRTK